MDLINKTEISSDRIREIIEFCGLNDLGDYVMIVKDCDIPIRASGHWDGGISSVAPSYLPVISVEISKEIKYPFEITGVEEKGYLRYLVLSREELFVYLIAHELRHLWQARSNQPFDDYQSQRDADKYAVDRVEAWRKNAHKT